jgi:phosphonate degradation associated HDIG domain protein
MSVYERITSLFGRRGADAYFGEQVSMLEHSLQTAYFAREERAPPPLVVAALLHDIGHLVEDVPADIADWHEDAHHEEVGRAWLARYFGPEVSEPVALHVPAKRYLCATEPAYSACLSSASVLTLKLQGGPMSPVELAAFEANPHHRDAVAVRRCDDRGKLGNFRAPGLETYRDLVSDLEAIGGRLRDR